MLSRALWLPKQALFQRHPSTFRALHQFWIWVLNPLIVQSLYTLLLLERDAEVRTANRQNIKARAYSFPYFAFHSVSFVSSYRANQRRNQALILSFNSIVLFIIFGFLFPSRMANLCFLLATAITQSRTTIPDFFVAIYGAIQPCASKIIPFILNGKLCSSTGISRWSTKIFGNDKILQIFNSYFSASSVLSKRSGATKI